MAQAAIFNIVYDNIQDGVIGSANFVAPPFDDPADLSLITHAPARLVGLPTGPRPYGMTDFVAFFGLNGDYLATSAVRVPAAAWLLGSALLGLIGVARLKESKA